MRDCLRLADDVRAALENGQPVVALESTVIAHGLPYPQNLDTARRMEALIRAHAATPATIAVLGGELCVGLTDAELASLAEGRRCRKVSRRDLPSIVATGGDGATTVAATATIAHWARIHLLATGGIGGVHRNAPFDISNDLPTLASVPVAVVCSGAKSILDLPATLEWLETAGVPVVGYGTDEFPAFFSRQSGLQVDVRVDTPEAAATIIRAASCLGLSSGMLIAIPVPAGQEVPPEVLEPAIAAALSAAEVQRVRGNALTPFLLRWLAQHTDFATLTANVALLEHNAAVAADIAVAVARIAAEQQAGCGAARDRLRHRRSAAEEGRTRP
jgi:pseudouridine-5'-phosphate glycosidase